MATSYPLSETLVGAWATNNRITVFLVDHLAAPVWTASIPGSPQRTVGMIAGHIHNTRCMWIRTLGLPHGIPVPAAVDRRRVRRKDLLRALSRSSSGIARLLLLGCEHGGRIPPTRAYTWRNLPLDVGHVLTYFVAHEGHHRGQIVMVARQLGHRLPGAVTNGLWQWTKRAEEARR